MSDGEDTDDGDASEGLAEGRRTRKLDVVVDKYNLDGIVDELESRWSRKNPEERYSIRELEKHFNSAVIRTVLEEEVGYSPVDYNPEQIFEILNDGEGVSESDERFIRQWMEDNVDLEELESDFVSYYSIFTFLRDVRNAESPNQLDNSPEKAKERGIDRIEQKKSNLKQGTDRALKGVKKANVVADNDYDIRVSVRVECPDCGTVLPGVEFIRQGGCECSVETEDNEDGGDGDDSESGEDSDSEEIQEQPSA
jgi:hypothetical protein